MSDIDKDKVVGVLNRILEAELAGIVRYTHYSFLVFGFGRIPIVSWLRQQADESLLHAQQVGEWITTLGAYPSLAIGPLLDSHKHDIAAILRESLVPGIAVVGRNAVSRARGVRAADGFGGGNACRGSGQNAQKARRSRRVCGAAELARR